MLLHRFVWQTGIILSVLSAGILGTCGSSAARAADTPRYQLTDLSLTGMNVVIDVNNHGDVVGFTGMRSIAVPGTGGTGTIGGGGVTASTAAASATPFDPLGSAIVVRDGQLQRVIIAGTPIAINDAGQVIGVGHFGPGQTTSAPFFFDGSSVHNLTTESGVSRDATLEALNDTGTIVGTNPNGTGIFTVTNGSVTNLGTLDFTHAFASDINNAGTIVGDVVDGGALTGFTRDAQGTLALLPTPVGFDNTFTFAINDSGQVAGFNRVGQNQVTARAFVFQDGVYTDLGLPVGYTDSVATNINDAGQVTGSLDPDTPFLFSDGAIDEINTLLAPSPGWARVESVVSINNSGQFVGYAIRASDGASVPVLATPVTATPVPLPAAVWPGLATLVGLATLSAARCRGQG